ncbi:MAG TPA: pyridoxamine 5'-phosphate oxidase [Verrucomicrobiae bacterium]|nr:pyridoxamine 5'-phosphate oxidase [Verrucomicrobiae bacterium]
MEMADIRREYTLAGLRRKDLETNPLRQFQKWFEEAVRLLTPAGAEASADVNAMTLATADTHGRPSSRIVLLKGINDHGFVFYTNYNSRKGRELAENPHAAITMFWPSQERQICASGLIVKSAVEDSEAYFKSRPRGSQLAAWASHQSEVVPDRATLESRLRELEAKHADGPVPRPPHWGGFILMPDRVEFWQGRPNRLHDRFRYSRQPGGSWLLERLAP